MECSELETPRALGVVEGQVGQVSISMRSVHFAYDELGRGVVIAGCEVVITEVEGENALRDSTLYSGHKAWRCRVKLGISQALFILYNASVILNSQCVLHTSG